MSENATAQNPALNDDPQALRDQIASLKAEIADLKSTNKIYDAILDTMPVYLFVKNIDDDFKYMFWNKAFAQHSKIPRERVIGYTDFEIFPNYDDALKFRKDDLDLVANGASKDLHETYEAADGSTRIVQTRKTICRTPDAPPMLIGVSFDITNIDGLDKRLVEERMKAENADRLKSAFLANMSHEIRTPLNAIVGFSDLLVNNDEPENQSLYADIIKQNSDILLQLINDILDISKIEAGTLEYVHAPMDLNETFRNVYEANKSRMHEGVELVYTNADSTQKLIINEDQNRIIQIVVNLINNAIKFTNEGSITFGYEIKGDWIEVYVRDTGSGIPADQVGKVFERFVKLDSFKQGTGLGLAISKLIVDLFGGKIWVTSKVGKGSEFRFTIPFAKDRKNNPWTNALPSAQTSAPQEPESVKRTLLIAEDNYSNFLLMDVLLKKHYKLLWAHDGEEAIRMYKKDKPDLILMDMKMPNIDGLEATQLIRTYSDDIPIIMVSANAFETDRQKAKEAGANDFLTKPVLRAPLFEVLNKYLK